MSNQNPKLEGSNLIDCIPVGGPCPNNCRPCYYNEGFYRDINEPLLPTLEDVGSKLVRVNSGGDSSVDFERVIKLTKQYPKRFYNTSLPHHIQDFPAPVVFTCNPKNTGWFYAITNVSNLMYVRVRVCMNNYNTRELAVRYYTGLRVPVVLTFLKFPLHYAVEFNEVYDMYYNDCYETKISITNTYKQLKPEYRDKILNEFRYNPLVLQCGSSESPYCKDCNNCTNLYDKFVAKGAL